MTKEEFIAKAKELGYEDADIEEILELIAESGRYGKPMVYDDFPLLEQPVY